MVIASVLLACNHDLFCRWKLMSMDAIHNIILLFPFFKVILTNFD